MKTLKHLIFVLTTVSACFFAPHSRGAVITSVKTVNWTDPTVWDASRSPMNNDTVNIRETDTVYVDLNSPVYTLMLVVVRGTLSFNVGQKLNFDCYSTLIVANGAFMIGGNLGSKINMCGVTLYRGGGDAIGYAIFTTSFLPVEWMSVFTRVINERQVGINWITASETNSDYFSIERSRAGEPFSSIGKVKGAGTVSSPRSYEFIDKGVAAGVNYYRIQQVDYNGRASYSRIFTAETTPVSIILDIHPNPCAPPCELKMQNNSSSEWKLFTLEFLDEWGKKVYSEMVPMIPEGSFSEALQTSGWKPGIYLVHAYSETEHYTFKLIVN